MTVNPAADATPTTPPTSYAGGFTKAAKPATSKVGKQADQNDFLAPVAELAKEWDDEKGEAKESYTVTIQRVDQDRVRRQLILAGKAIDKSIRQVWTDVEAPAKLERGASAADKETYKAAVKYVAEHVIVTFFPMNKITRKRAETTVAAPVEAPESAELSELRDNLSQAVTALEAGEKDADKRVQNIQAQIDALILAELEPSEDEPEQPSEGTEQPETDSAIK